MQTDNRVLDQMARFFTNAAGAANAFREEVENIVRPRLEKLVADLDFVPRDEFNAVKLMASKARAENDKLAARIATLEAQLATLKTAEKLRPNTTRPRTPAVKKKPAGKL